MSFFSKQIDKRIAVYQRELIETHYREVENMYRALGGIMKENPTWSTYLITSMEYFESLFGRAGSAA